jgi:hypothetical protein
MPGDNAGGGLLAMLTANRLNRGPSQGSPWQHQHHPGQHRNYQAPRAIRPVHVDMITMPPEKGNMTQAPTQNFYKVNINGKIMGRRSRSLKKSLRRALLTWFWISSQS